MYTVVARLLFHEANQANRTAAGEEGPSYVWEGAVCFGQIERVVLRPHAFLHMHQYGVRPETKVEVFGHFNSFLIAN